MAQPIDPRIQIITERGFGDNILSMDVNTEEHWILTSHSNGNVSIWNYLTKASVGEFIVSDVPRTDPIGLTHWICSVKFIAREKCFVAGSGNGKIHVVVYTPTTNNLTLTEFKKFHAHGDWVESLAVHPVQPFVLSASYDKRIKLWEWKVNQLDKKWECIQTFKGHNDFVKNVTFNQDGNTFASASQDCTVKIWSTEDRSTSPKHIFSFKCGDDTQQHVAYFSTNEKHYVIAGSLEGPARVFDLLSCRRIKELEGPESEVYGCNVGVLNCQLENPVLITVSGDGNDINFLDATTYEARFNMINLEHGPAQDFAYIEIEGIRSLAIAFSGAIALVDMTEEPKRLRRKTQWLKRGKYAT